MEKCKTNILLELIDIIFKYPDTGKATGEV